MAKRSIPTKATFGGCDVAHFSPAPPPDGPTALNLVLSFEEALKLHLSIGQALARLNGYNRSTVAGRRSAVNLCVYPKVGRVTVNEGALRPQTGRSTKASHGEECD